MTDKPIIVIINREAWKPDISVMAVDSSGHFLAGHVSSNMSFARSDLGRSLPEGVEQVWVEMGDERIPEPCGGCDECGGPE